jgi:hypothetical protein
MKMPASWDTVPWSVEIDRRFRSAYDLHQDDDGWGPFEWRKPNDSLPYPHSSAHFWNVVLLVRDYTAQYLRRTSVIFVHVQNISHKRYVFRKCTLRRSVDRTASDVSRHCRFDWPQEFCQGQYQVQGHAAHTCCVSDTVSMPTAPAMSSDRSDGKLEKTGPSSECGLVEGGSKCRPAIWFLHVVPKTALNHRLNLNSVNHLIFVKVKCGLLFEVKTEFLNNI